MSNKDIHKFLFLFYLKNCIFAPQFFKGKIMDTLKQFSIPIKGIKNGIHQFEFQLSTKFFENFENSPVKDGKFEVKLEFDKRIDMFVLTFDINGSIKANCDRCLESIDLPIEDQQNLIIKISEEDVLEEVDVIYILSSQSELNVAKYIYEYIILALPLTNVYDCDSEENKPCNEEMLKHLDVSPRTDEETKDNPVWDVLKNLKKN